jgi:hypothetical protein
MVKERDELLKETIKELLAVKGESESRDNLLEKLIRKFIRTDIHRISEFEPLMSDSIKNRFQFELDAIKFNML